MNNSSYTIFVLEQRESNKSNNYFIGDNTNANESVTNQNLTLGYSADGTIKHSQSSDNNYTSSVTNYSQSSGKPRIFSFIHDKASGKKTYINGLLAAQSSDKSNLTNITSLKIGSGYQGQIGELIIFARALNPEERQSVEDYLGKKWTSPILRSTGISSLSGSCTTGVVSNTGCQIACSVPAITGITNTTVADGSGTLTCSSANHFFGSISYTCSNGVFSYTDATSCSCQTGYTISGSVCVSINPNYSGGTESTVNISGTDYKIHTFTSSGTLTCAAGVTAKILVVGGGASGGQSETNAGGGGGGGGGVVFVNSYSMPANTSIAVTVGNGGAAPTLTSPPGNLGIIGSDSSFGSVIVAKGGGGGAFGVLL